MKENQYVIISKIAIQKRIERLKQSREVEPDNYQQSYLNGKIKVAEEILSQSTPLIPEIEKAFDASKITTGMNQRNQFAYKYKNSKDYISNLKLDI